MDQRFSNTSSKCKRNLGVCGIETFFGFHREDIPFIEQAYNNWQQATNPQRRRRFLIVVVLVAMAQAAFTAVKSSGFSSSALGFEAPTWE
jgi:hypothetical protein